MRDVLKKAASLTKIRDAATAEAVWGTPGLELQTPDDPVGETQRARNRTGSPDALRAQVSKNTPPVHACGKNQEGICLTRINSPTCGREQIPL
jgi:hypothetical protein